MVIWNLSGVRRNGIISETFKILFGILTQQHLSLSGGFIASIQPQWNVTKKHHHFPWYSSEESIIIISLSRKMFEETCWNPSDVRAVSAWLAWCVVAVGGPGPGLSQSGETREFPLLLPASPAGPFPRVMRPAESWTQPPASDTNLVQDIRLLHWGLKTFSELTYINDMIIL